jgi:hypothetical protein
MKKKPPLTAFICLFLLSTLLAAFWAVPASAALSWNIQTVDENAYTSGIHCPIALDSKGLPHIAYTDVRVEPDTRFQTPLVMYANSNGTSWKTQQIAKGKALSLVLDADDHPHILYHLSWEPLMYACWTGSKWNIQTVDPDTFSGGGFGLIALDSYGNPHVAYNDGTTIEYADSNGEEWNIQKVATDESGELPNLSFVLDKNDTPYIMYCPSTYADYSRDVGIRGMNITLATYQNSSWKIQPLALPTPTGEYGNIVVDSKGGLHSIFTQHYYLSSENKNTLSTLLYASWNGTAWDMQTVVSNIGFDSMSLALDSHDNPHIISDGVYASWTGTAWDVQSTDVSGYLAVDADGNLHVSYLARSPMIISNLTYATANATEPTEATPTPEVTPISPDAPLLIVASAVIIGAIIAVTVYVWKKQGTKP